MFTITTEIKTPPQYSESFNFNQFIHELTNYCVEKKLKQNYIDDLNFSFEYRNRVLKYKKISTVQFILSGINIEKIKLTFSIRDSFLISIIVLILSILLSLFALFYIYLGIGLFILIPLLDYMIESLFVKNIIVDVLSKFYPIADRNFSKIQNKWLSNPVLCPACGYEINKYSEHCVNCGLKIQSKAKKMYSNINTSETNSGINYIYNKKKNKD